MIDDETPQTPSDSATPPEPETPLPEEPPTPIEPNETPTPADQLSAGASRLRGRVTERLRAEGARFDGDQAGDFADSLRAVGQAPFVVAGAVGALAATIAGLVLSFVLWIVLSDSLVGGFGAARTGHRFHSLWGAACTFWMVLSQVPLHAQLQLGGALDGFVNPGNPTDSTSSDSALLGLAIVIVILVVSGRLALRRLPDAAVGTQRLAIAVFALTFGVLSLLVSLFSYRIGTAVGGDVTVQTRVNGVHGWAFVLPLIWALIAGVIVLGRSTLALVPGTVARWWTDYVRAPLRVLAGALVLTTVFGFVSTILSVLAHEDKRQAVQVALVQVLDEGVAFFRNGALVGLHPVHQDVGSAHYAYVLVLSILIVWVGALYAGFVSARATGAGTLSQGALTGALVGPVWAVAMAIISELAKGIDTSGDFSGWKLFFSLLVGGALLGAAGGVLAVRGPRRFSDGSAVTAP